MTRKELERGTVVYEESDDERQKRQERAAAEYAFRLSREQRDSLRSALTRKSA